MANARSARAGHRLWLPIGAMAGVITLSNVAVNFQINDWLTWGAFTYPLAFLVTDLTNRALGSESARRVVYAGFAVGVVCSIVAGLLGLSTVRIALASGAAFLIAQLLDILIFDRLRRASWWKAPFVSSSLASFVDTLMFFGLAFAFTPVPWLTLALGDYGVKLAMALLLLLPFRALMSATAPTAVKTS
ncbi:MAG: VUT family protein [Kiloniellales bacterium]|nr:VUT family protein [Kiloniellales bacterium]